jgi:hypothetical protein
LTAAGQKQLEVEHQSWRRLAHAVDQIMTLAKA